uniref:Uncharacterized protein LOC102803833 n=1 Tax=Saccoglossus kowalevskii TaxID=10224 RepID=A0ABM0LYT0_SACKO|nr:PREDICTED: uncharacterized protein LOC102803833 [Saccoglossus kowalevskii]
MSHTTFTSSGQDEEMRDSEEEEELRMLEKEKKISQGSDFLMQRHLKSGATNGEGSFTKSSRQASMTALVGTPHDRTDEALSGESVDGRITEQSSKPNTVPDISSREESLDSAGGIPRLPNSDDQMISTEDSDLAPGENSETEESRVDVTKMEMKNLKATPQIKREVTWDDNVTTSSRGPSGVYNLSRSSMRSGAKSPKSVTIDPVPNTAYYAEAGTSLPSGRASEATTLTSYSNAPIPECPGLYGWRWEVAYIYAEIMTFLCLNGKTANIQKLALQGSGKVKALQYKQEKIGPLESAGLLDLVDFHAKTRN